MRNQKILKLFQVFMGGVCWPKNFILNLGWHNFVAGEQLKKKTYFHEANIFLYFKKNIQKLKQKLKS